MKNLSPKTRRCFLLVIVAMIAVTVSSAFAIVWMQQQISRTANGSVALEDELAVISDKLRYLDEKISKFQQPIALQARAGSLRPSTENQIVWVPERNGPAGRSYAHVSPYEVSTGLALVEMEFPLTNR